MPLHIRPYQPGKDDAVVALVLGIQRGGFGIPITVQEQPDLLDIPGHYRRGRGNFWVGLDGAEVVGTIGLLDIGQGDAARQRTFVAPDQQGAPHRAGNALLAACLDWGRQHELTRVILGTTEQFQAAYRSCEGRVPPDRAGRFAGALPAHATRYPLLLDLAGAGRGRIDRPV